LEFEELEQQSGEDYEYGKKIEPGEVVPDFFEGSADGVIMPSRKAILYLNRCKEGSGSMDWEKKQAGRRRPGLSRNGPYCCCGVADAAVVAAVSE